MSNRVTASFSLSPETIARINDLARQYDGNRSKALEALISTEHDIQFNGCLETLAKLEKAEAALRQLRARLGDMEGILGGAGW